MTPRHCLISAGLVALLGWPPAANAQDGTRVETRSGMLEFESSG